MTGGSGADQEADKKIAGLAVLAELAVLVVLAVVLAALAEKIT
jgi:hypothetical protein